MGKLDLSAFVLNAGRKSAILDTNLLVLRLTSLVDPAMLKTFKRVGAFRIEDAFLLEDVLDSFLQVVTTAYVLAEASNLGSSLYGPQRNAWFWHLAQYATATEERHVPTPLIGALPETIPFGVADAALAHLSEDFVLITAEHRLSGYLQNRGRQVLNFNNLRPLWMLRP